MKKKSWLAALFLVTFLLTTRASTPNFTKYVNELAHHAHVQAVKHRENSPENELAENGFKSRLERTSEKLARSPAHSITSADCFKVTGEQAALGMALTLRTAFHILKGDDITNPESLAIYDSASLAIDFQNLEGCSSTDSHVIKTRYYSAALLSGLYSSWTDQQPWHRAPD